MFGSRVRVESTAKIAELELAEKVCLFFSYLFVRCTVCTIHRLKAHDFIFLPLAKDERKSRNDSQT